MQGLQEVIPEIYSIPLAGLTAPALLGIAIVLILSGRLIPRRTYDDLREDRDRWQRAFTVSEEARLSQSKQLDAAMEVGKTVTDVMVALDKFRREGEVE